MTTMPNGSYMDNQHEIDWNMRGVLVDWLIEVHGKFRLLPETMFLAVHLVDRCGLEHEARSNVHSFLSLRSIALVRFQLVGVTALFIAAKVRNLGGPASHTCSTKRSCALRSRTFST